MIKGIVLSWALATAPTGDTRALSDAGVFQVREATTLEGQRLADGWWLAPGRMTLVGQHIYALEAENKRLKSEPAIGPNFGTGFLIGVIVGVVVTGAVTVYAVTR